MSDLKQDFIKEVHAAARARYAVEVFADIARAMAIALNSPFTLGERKKALEDEYAQIKDRYTPGYYLHGMPMRRIAA